MSVLGQIYRLQQTDSEWDERSQRLEELEQSLGESDDLVRARESAAAAESDLAATRVKLRALELEVGTLTARLKANQERMYGGKVRNPKELSGLSDEAKSLRHHRTELEDTELDLMVLADAQEAELKEKNARLGQTEAAWQRQHATLLAEKDQLEARQRELVELRGEVRSRIRPADIASYDELRAELGGIAVALLRHGMCQVCGVDVPTAEVQGVERGETHLCPVCGRLLYGGG
jgi:predicted  nucleic acid-binding Zn-ribbon protein